MEDREVKKVVFEELCVCVIKLCVKDVCERCVSQNYMCESVCVCDQVVCV